MNAAPGPVWAGDPISAYRFETLDAFDVVFHKPSGLTHLLGGEAVTILGLLVERASDEADLTQRLAVQLALAVDESLTETVAVRIDELADAGLITKA